MREGGGDKTESIARLRENKKGSSRAGEGNQSRKSLVKWQKKNKEKSNSGMINMCIIQG